MDRIVALQNGVIVEEGALDVLIQKKGFTANSDVCKWFGVNMIRVA